ncbi:MAG: zinc-dependent metalloprotease [Vulcanimicrobiaceae bacterium]
MSLRSFAFLVVVFVFYVSTDAVRSADAGAAPTKPVACADFTKGLTPQRGLFTLWRKGGKVYLQLAKDQLDEDFIQTAEPSSGLGGYGITPGLPYLQFARIMRFSRTDDRVAITWPNTSFVADNPAGTTALEQNFAPSVLAVTPIVCDDVAAGSMLLDASPFLGDVLDLTDALRVAVKADKNPPAAYALDPDRSYFGESKAFPDNVIIEAKQTFASAQPVSADGSLTLDNVPDPRMVQIGIKYNIARTPPAGSYMPRLADSRVGYYPDILLDYSKDRLQERQLRYILRWNLSRHPMVYYISSSVPPPYRSAIRTGLLKWNQAFAKIGIADAVQVLDQPADPAWDPDDIRYNVVHWLTQSNGGGYAQAGLVFDPRTGELVKTSIVIDADLMYFGNIEGEDFSGPVAGEGNFRQREAAYAAGAHASALFGLWALRAQANDSWRYIPPNYANDFLQSIVLHESGHNWGLQHNFIASQAYSPKELQNRAFTSRYGLANTVMEYTPTNVWPKGTPRGDYFQLVLGPYDYYAIHWGYAKIPNARTPQDEVPTLQRWASVWSDPRYRYENDEDVAWRSGHAIDPRVAQFDLSSDNLAWCEGQMKVGSQLLASLGRRYNDYGETHDPQRTAFTLALAPFSQCRNVAAHYIGGEYLSRAHVGDPHAAIPLMPVPRAEAQRAFAMLDRTLFSNTAWQISPRLLRQLVYTEWVTDFQAAPWQYAPPVRHDEPIATIVEDSQRNAIEQFLNPVVLQRIDDFTLKYKPGTTMSLVDLFTWTHRSVFGDLRDGTIAQVGEVHRSLQQWYARKLVELVRKPPEGTPYDAQSLAREDLTQLRTDIAGARRTAKVDALRRAHLDALESVAREGLTKP